MEEQTDNKNLPTVKILISYHKPAVLLKRNLQKTEA